nr:type VI secretion system tube protein Hcp [Enterobacter hormaechei]
MSPYLAVAACEGRRLQKAIIKYYELLKREQKERSTPLRLIAW